MSNHEKLLYEASKVWCPDVSDASPRRSSDKYRYQAPVTNRYQLVTNLLEAGENGNDGFVSTYSFPRGHTDDGANIPKIDTIFIDFDVPADSEYRERNRTLDAWKRSMSDLLIRVQSVAEAIIEGSKQDHWRASLSGHKGIHLFFDFEEIDVSNGSYTQFKRGLEKYGKNMIRRLDEISGGINIEPWVDVDSSDLARLVRHPNTPHPGAEHRDDTAWCVPVSIEELATLTVNEYLELTSGPREVPNKERTPSAKGRREIAVEIRNATGGSFNTKPSTGKDPTAIKTYRNESNKRIQVSDIPILVANKPCIMEFVARDDAFAYGDESRTMEINVIKELIKEQNRVPIDVIVDFFRVIDGFDEDYTRNLVEDLISRYNGPFTCQNIWDAGGEFCIGMNDDYESTCKIYRQKLIDELHSESYTN